MLGCAGGSPIKIVGGMPLRPNHEQSVVVEHTTSQWGFIKATLGAEGHSLGVYFHDDSTCGAVVKKGATLTYHGTGRFGSVSGPGGSCVVAGTSALPEFRDRQGTVVIPDTLDRKTAFFKIAHQNGEIWVRGQFPFARLLGFMPDDLILVLPATDDCKAASSGDSAFMEFRQMGSTVFILEASSARCVVSGVIDPAPAH
jgi:hypothetical protein